MLETVGQKLKEAREARGLSIRKVSDDTKISARHLEALETDNFHYFPSETYSLGFLRSYSLYLGLDENRMIQFYKSDQMMQRKTPIKELTEKPVSMLDYLGNYMKYAILPIILAGLGFGGYYYYYHYDPSSGSPPQKNTAPDVSFNVQDYLKNSGKVPKEKTDSMSFANGIIIALVAKGEGIDFLLDGTEAYIVLKDMKYRDPGSKQNNVELVFYPGKQSIFLSEGSPYETAFPWLSSKLGVHILGATPNNVKLKVEKLGKNDSFDEKHFSNQRPYNKNQNNEIIKPENFTITLVAKTIGENYVEFYIDGQQKKRGIISAGEVLHFEANDSIQMKIGDAGAIDVIVNGKSLKRGRRGQQINRIIRKVKDPLEQLKYRLEIKDT